MTSAVAIEISLSLSSKISCKRLTGAWRISPKPAPNITSYPIHAAVGEARVSLVSSPAPVVMIIDPQTIIGPQWPKKVTQGPDSKATTAKLRTWGRILTADVRGESFLTT